MLKIHGNTIQSSHKGYLGWEDTKNNGIDLRLSHFRFTRVFFPLGHPSLDLERRRLVHKLPDDFGSGIGVCDVAHTTLFRAAEDVVVQQPGHEFHSFHKDDHSFFTHCRYLQISNVEASERRFLSSYFITIIYA